MLARQQPVVSGTELKPLTIELRIETTGQKENAQSSLSQPVKEGKGSLPSGPSTFHDLESITTVGTLPGTHWRQPEPPGGSRTSGDPF